MRWWEYLSRFEYKIDYIKGETNKVADSLSCYYMSDSPGETHDVSEYVNADSRLDPDGDDLPKLRLKELASMRAVLRPHKQKTIEAQDKVEPQDAEAAELRENNEVPKAQWDVIEHPKWKNVLPALGEQYPEDKFFGSIWGSPDRHKRFEKEETLLWTKNRLNQRVICFPKGTHKNLNIRGIVIDASHETIGHLGCRKTTEYIRRWFWWPTMAEDIDNFCKSCGRCQVTKTSRSQQDGFIRYQFQADLGNPSEWTSQVH